MKPTSPWSVKGVEPEAREAAKMAARRAGVPVGVWLSNTIRKMAAEQLRSGPGPSAAQAPQAPAAAPQAEPQAYASAQGPAPQPPPSAPQPPAPTTEAVLQSINRLATKLEQSEQRTADTLAPLAEKVRNLSEQMDTIKDTKSLDSDPLERALARMAERLDQIEDGPRIGGSTESAPPSRGGRRRQGFFSKLFSD